MKIVKPFRAACCVVLCSIFPVFASAADNPVPKFESFVLKARNATNANTPVYLNEHKQAWAKRRFFVTDINYDVKKTDSLVSPVIGLVSFHLVTEQTNLYPTKEEAEASTIFDTKSSSPFRISMTYSYIGTKWSFSKGSVEWLSGVMKGEGYELSEEKIKNQPTAIPNVAILYWLPK